AAIPSRGSAVAGVLAANVHLHVAATAEPAAAAVVPNAAGAPVTAEPAAAAVVPNAAGAADYRFVVAGAVVPSVAAVQPGVAAAVGRPGAAVVEPPGDPDVPARGYLVLVD